MSKSLKNFIKIKEIIKKINPRILRLYYNTVNYDAILNCNPEDEFSEAKSLDKTFTEFFQASNYYLMKKNENIANNN